MVENILRALHGTGQITRVARLAVAHRKAVEAPALTAGPRRSRRIALTAAVLAHTARGGVVNDDVIGAPVLAEMVAKRRVGMGDGDIAEPRIARQPARLEKHFQIHHVVDDHQIGVGLAVLVVPRTDQPHFGIETLQQRLRRFHQQPLISLVAGKPQPETHRTADHEAQVVGTFVRRKPRKGRRAATGAPQPRGVLRFAVKEPQGAREKAAHPAADAFQLKGARTVQTRRVERRIRKFGIQLRRLDAGAVQRPADKTLCERFRNDKSRRQTTKENKERFLHTIPINLLDNPFIPKQTADQRRPRFVFRINFG